MSSSKPRPGDAWTEVEGSWQCPACGKRFVQRGLSHSCGVYSLEHHFEKRPAARALFDAFCRKLEDVGGPFRLSIAKTRIGMITRMTFAAITPRKDYLHAHVVLRRQLASDRFVKIEPLPPYFVHHFEIRSAQDLDDEACEWLRAAYEAGK